MAFLFKSKKSAPPPSSLPAATRNLHTSDGTPGSSNSTLDKTANRKAQSPPPTNAGANGSLSSLNGQPASAPPAQNAPFVRRERAESEVGSRPANLRPAPPRADLYPWSQKPLTFQNSQTNPFPRYGAAVNAVASKEGGIYMMGGLINGSTVRGDLWMVENTAADISCYAVTTFAEGPGPRVGHSSLLVGNAFIVFGGDTKMDDSDTLDDTLYLLNTSSRHWSRASPPGPRPCGRYGHTLNILGSKIYVFGGQVEGAFYNDLIAFDLNALQNPTTQWEFLIRNTGAEIRPNVPPARTNHTVISHNDQLFLFGGTDGNQWFNDVWTYDPRTNKWTQQDCIGYIPAPREGHSAALVNDVMYIFGGRTEHGDDLGDLAAFRISLKRWYTFQNMGPSPSPRSGHSMTAIGKQIVVLAGEPSSAPRDPKELSMVYILDTAKIRYPNDGPTPTSQQKVEQPTSPSRRPSDPPRGAIAPRSTSREGQNQFNAIPMRNEALPTELPGGGPMQRPEQGTTKALQQQQAQQPAVNQQQQQLQQQRATASPGPVGSPPQTSAQSAKVNGVPPPRPGARGKSSGSFGDIREAQPAAESVRQVTTTEPTASTPLSPAVREAADEPALPPREASPESHGRRTPTHQPVSKAKVMEAGEAAPLVSSGVARQRSQRSSRAHSSFDGSEDGLLGRTNPSRIHGDHRASRTFAEEPHSPKITPHQEALMKELEAVKGRNAWYASELALARKAGYTASSSPTVDDRATMQFADDDRPLVEAFMTMRSELSKMQQSMDKQASSTARKIAEVEHQRDAAITEAAYARAKLAAHGGSQRSTPVLGSNRDVDEADRPTDISRRLALALAATNEHKFKAETLAEDLKSERRAREAAEDAHEAAQRRLDELSSSRNPAEAEALKAELYEAQNTARAESGRRAELEKQLRLLEVDHKELRSNHEETSSKMNQHVAALTTLEAAVAASSSKASLYQRQIEDERQQREIVERKLTQLRSDHEDVTCELENVTRRLRDTEELAESHAAEASTHREAVMLGFANISRSEKPPSRDGSMDERLATLQEASEKADQLARSNQQAADAAAQKLRSAEERIAGLEAYQEQSSREGLSVRRQLQAALRDLQSHQNENRELRTHLESQQHEASALSVQHGALKDLLTERGMDMSSVRKSPNSDQAGSRYGTPEQGRLRELEQQLSASHRAHDETKNMLESREQEAERAYRERLEQLENDYQSLLTYVKGTEKMLKKMKEELTKYKSANQKLSTELEVAKDGKRSASSANTDASDWAAERDVLQHSINDMRSQMTTQIQTLENNMAAVRNDLLVAQAERDQQRARHEEASKVMEKKEDELTQLKSENSLLETRALDAEHRVTLLLDRVDSSVSHYRRQSQMHSGPNGLNLVSHGHDRAHSVSTMTDTSSIDDGDDGRGSVALDNLASELETLRSQWENSSRSYRFSDRFDIERTPTAATSNANMASGEPGPSTDTHHKTAGLSETLADFRTKMHEDESRTPTNSDMSRL